MSWFYITIIIIGYLTFTAQLQNISESLRQISSHLSRITHVNESMYRDALEEGERAGDARVRRH